MKQHIGTVILLLLLFQCSCSQLISSTIAGTTNQCICTFDVPPIAVCTAYDIEQVSIIERVEDEVANLTSQIDDFRDERNQWEERYTEFDKNITRLMKTCKMVGRHNGELSDLKYKDGSKIRKELAALEQMMNTVEKDMPDFEILQKIENKLDYLSSVIVNVTTNIVGMEEADWRSRIANLEAELTECREKPSDIQKMITDRQWPKKGSQESCKKLSLILLPFTVRDKRQQQAKTLAGPTIWFTDPLGDPTAVWLGIFNVRMELCPRRRYGDCRSWHSSYIEVTRSTLHWYNETQQFEKSGTNYVTYYLPHQIERTAIVAYNGHLFYIEYNNRTLVKYDVNANATVTWRFLPEDIGIGDVYNYNTDGRSSIDLEVDESGLWMVYSTTRNQGLLVVSKINTTSLEIEDTWFGNFPKQYPINCFIVCGTLYCVSAHDSHSVKVNYYYDTNTNIEGFMDMSFTSKYDALEYLKYNPYEQKLYAWDNGYAIVYDLIFE